MPNMRGTPHLRKRFCKGQKRVANSNPKARGIKKVFPKYNMVTERQMQSKTRTDRNRLEGDWIEFKVFYFTNPELTVHVCWCLIDAFWSKHVP